MTTQERLQTLRRCSQVWEAEILRDRLAAAGFTAFVQGAETGRSLSYVGVALGGVKVQVPACELEAARELLAADAEFRQGKTPWECPRCGEPNEATFEFCYSCSMPRPEASRSEPEPSIGVGQAVSRAERATNPYHPAGVPEWEASHAAIVTALGVEEDSREDQLREQGRRALACCVFGVIFPFPPVFLISMGLAIRTLMAGATAYPQLYRRLIALVVVNVLATVATTLFWWVM